MVVTVDWHRYCEQYTEHDAATNYVIVGEPIAIGDWFASDGYIYRCDDQNHASHRPR